MSTSHGTRLVIRWDVSLQRQLETEHEKTSEVGVRFIAQKANRTRVELEHRNLDRRRSRFARASRVERERRAGGRSAGPPTGKRSSGAARAERS